MCILIKDISQRLPLESSTAVCSLYQGRQGDINQSVRGKYRRTRFRRRQQLNCCERNASVCHVCPVNRKTGEGRAECSKGGGEGETKSDGCGRNASVYRECPVSRTTAEGGGGRRGGGWNGGERGAGAHHGGRAAKKFGYDIIARVATRPTPRAPALGLSNWG